MSGHAEALAELADLLGVISHPDRLKLLLELRSGRRDVASLTASCSLSQSRTSQHLSLLKAHHLVRAQRDGRRVYYSLVRSDFATWILDGLGFIGLQQELQDSIRELRKSYSAPTPPRSSPRR